MCDDIGVTVVDNQIEHVDRACALGQAWFELGNQPAGPACMIEGRPATLSEGIEHAAQLLVAARYPLIYGLRDTTCEAQRIAEGIADRLGAILDTPTATEHGPTGVSFQGVGEVTCSLGEITHRGDLIILWGTNPPESHPRHFERYSLFPQGMFLPRGRADRTCVVVDVKRTVSVDQADVFLQIKPGRDFEALWILRALVNGVALDETAVESSTGVSLADWQDLARRMKASRFGVVLFGEGLSTSLGKHMNTEALLALVRDMNAFTRFVAKPMRQRGNLIGADSVITWRSGFPFGVNYARGYPRFNPGEYTAAEVLSRGEADAALIVACDARVELEPAAADALRRIPLIVIDDHVSDSARAARVAFRTGMQGIHSSGTVYRMDDVPLPLRPMLDSPFPSAADVLTALERRVRELTATRARISLNPATTNP